MAQHCFWLATSIKQLRQLLAVPRVILFCFLLPKWPGRFEIGHFLLDIKVKE